MIFRLVFALLLMGLGAAVASTPSWRDDIVATDDVVVMDQGYLDAHLDQQFRARGVELLGSGRGAEVVRNLRRAARYGGKPSQALLGALLWEGVEVAMDRATAYAWMDLASERGYCEHLVTREQYWKELTPAERALAVKVGGPIYDVYADVVAKPRLNRQLRHAVRSITGSRTGFVGNLSIIPMGRYSGDVDGNRFYDRRHWDPKHYWRVQDQLWNPHAPRGNVEVGPLRIGPAVTN